MVNPLAGEAALTIGDRPYTMRLSLGALASLEAAFGCDDLSSLMDKLLAGDLSAAALSKVLEEALIAGGDVARPHASALLQQAGKPLALNAAYVQLMRASFAP